MILFVYKLEDILEFKFVGYLVSKNRYVCSGLYWCCNDNCEGRGGFMFLCFVFKLLVLIWIMK